MSPVCEAFWDYGPSEPGPLSHESGNCIAMPPGCALPGSAQNQSGKFRLARSQPESQRDSVAKPRVGESASLPWVIVPQISQPQRGCGQTSLMSLDRGMAATALRLGLLVEREPRVAAARQPWAASLNPVGIAKKLAHPSSKIRVRCGVNAPHSKTLREFERRVAVAPAFGLRWLQHRFWAGENTR